MMFVEVLNPRRPYADLAGTTDKAVIDRGWRVVTGSLGADGIPGPEVYFVQFAVNLTAAEEDAVRRRLGSASQVEEDLQDRALSAYKNLQDFEALASPTNAQTVAVVKLLCKVVRGLVRLQLRRLDAAD